MAIITTICVNKFYLIPFIEDLANIDENFCRGKRLYSVARGHCCTKLLGAQELGISCE